jgi:hypothetical protein
MWDEDGSFYSYRVRSIGQAIIAEITYPKTDASNLYNINWKKRLINTPRGVFY